MITRIDGKPVTFRDDAEVLQFFRSVPAGRTLAFTIVRLQKTLVVRVKAAPPPGDAAARWRRNDRLSSPRPR